MVPDNYSILLKGISILTLSCILIYIYVSVKLLERIVKPT